MDEFKKSMDESSCLYYENELCTQDDKCDWSGNRYFAKKRDIGKGETEYCYPKKIGNDFSKLSQSRDGKDAKQHLDLLSQEQYYRSYAKVHGLKNSIEAREHASGEAYQTRTPEENKEIARLAEEQNENIKYLYDPLLEKLPQVSSKDGKLVFTMNEKTITITTEQFENEFATFLKTFDKETTDEPVV